MMLLQQVWCFLLQFKRLLPFLSALFLLPSRHHTVTPAAMWLSVCHTDVKGRQWKIVREIILWPAPKCCCWEQPTAQHHQHHMHTHCTYSSVIWGFRCYSCLLTKEIQRGRCTMYGMENRCTIVVRTSKARGLLGEMTESGMITLQLCLQNCQRMRSY